MSSSDDDLLLLICSAIVLKRKKNKKKKKLWMKQWYKRRNPSTHENLLNVLRLTAEDDYGNFLRMDGACFDDLLSMVKPMIEKQNTVMREAISPSMRLTITLRYLATGSSFEHLKFVSAISPRSLGRIVIECCEAIIQSLSNLIQLPQSESQWKAIAEDFNNNWNFPNCIGAIDGKHIAIKKPPSSGSHYYNYKKFFSIVLMAAVNANYEFIVADVGTNGRISDGGVLKNTEFGKALYNNNSLQIPQPSELPNNSKKFPYVFVGDNAFQMQENLMKPYCSATFSNKERVFNYRLSRARRIVENVFGIMVSRFGVLQTTIALSPEKAQTVVLACCYLHNYLRKKKYYIPPELIDNEDIITGNIVNRNWRQNVDLNTLECIQTRNSTTKSKEIRENFAEHFMNEGAVSWQNKYLK